MKVHRLKCWPRDFAAIKAGTKRHEARKDDRGFEIGDVLRLKEWKPDDPEACNWEASGAGLTGSYTGEHFDVRVLHLTRGEYGLDPDLAIMSIDPILHGPAKDPEQRDTDYLIGRAAARIEALQERIRAAGFDESENPTLQLLGRLSERAQAIQLLRRICDTHGDNDWPDDLHLADILLKHLIPYLEAELEEEGVEDPGVDPETLQRIQRAAAERFHVATETVAVTMAPSPACAIDVRIGIRMDHTLMVSVADELRALTPTGYELRIIRRVEGG